MKLKSMVTLVVAVVAVAACGWWCVYCLRQRAGRFRSQKDYAAAMSRLNDTVRQVLDNYYDRNAGYPQSLSELSIPFALAQARPEMLDDFSYTPGPGYYIVSWEAQTRDGPLQTHTEHAAKGRVIFVEYYEDGQLVTRTEYPNGLQEPDSRTVKQYRAGRIFSMTEYKDGKISAQDTEENESPQER